MNLNIQSKQMTKLHPEWDTNTGAMAVQALVENCLQHQGGSTFPIIDFLLGLYNGALWKPDMQLLCRRIDDDNFELVLKAMRFIRQTNREPHEFFTHGDSLFDTLKTLTNDAKPSLPEFGLDV